jgi:hypothetical protein
MSGRDTELEFLKSLWGLGTKEEEGLKIRALCNLALGSGGVPIPKRGHTLWYSILYFVGRAYKKIISGCVQAELERGKV